MKPARKPKSGRTEHELTAMDKKAETPKKLRLKLLGLGGAGGNIIQHIATARTDETHPLTGVDLAVVNADAAALESISGAERIQIGMAVTHGMGAGGDPDVGARAALRDAERLEFVVQNLDVTFLATGLGGGTGTGAAPIVARLAKQAGSLVVAFVMLPFGFEGERRKQQALAGLEQLKMYADVVICFQNDKLAKLAGESATVQDAFAQCNELVATATQAIWQLFARRGLIRVDFADLRATLGAKHYEGLLSHAEAEGPDKVRDAIKTLLDNPLFDGSEVLPRAESVLVSILGGPDLTLADMQRAVEPITRQAHRARAVMGAAIDENYRDRFAITVIVATNLATRKPVEQTQVGRRPVETLTGRTQPAPAVAVPESAPVSSSKKKEPAKPKQETLPLEGVTRGRFDKSEPTLYDGEDLDVPTYLRRGVALRQ